MRVSTRGGNQSESGARSYADAISVTECAIVNDVTTTMSERRRRNGMTRHKQEQQVIDPVEDVEEPVLDEAKGRLVPTRVQSDDARVAVHVERAFGAAGRQEAKHDVDADAQPGEAGAD